MKMTVSLTGSVSAHQSSLPRYKSSYRSVKRLSIHYFGQRDDGSPRINAMLLGTFGEIDFCHLIANLFQHYSSDDIGKLIT